MTEEVQISVALVTRNRPESLCRCLRSWRQQSVQPAEIVVSDDSDDNVASKVRQLTIEFGCRYVRGPRRGLYANRNAAMSACTGTHILSADDDHEHPDGFFAIVLSRAQREPLTVWSFGEVQSWEAAAKEQWEIPGQLSQSGALRPSVDGEGCWAISDGATLYPGKVLAAGCRFFETIRFGDAYKELGCLLWRMGFKIRPVKEIGVVHHIRDVGRSFDHTDEEVAATIFAVAMATFVYRCPGFNSVSTLFYFLRHAWRSEAKIRTLRRAFEWVRLRRHEVAGSCKLHP